MVTQYPIQIAKKVASGIAMAAFWIERHDPICATTKNSICARVTIFRSNWKGEKERRSVRSPCPTVLESDTVACIDGRSCGGTWDIVCGIR